MNTSIQPTHCPVKLGVRAISGNSSSSDEALAHAVLRLPGRGFEAARLLVSQLVLSGNTVTDAYCEYHET